MEVFADEFKEIKKQAIEIKNWGRNVYVKIPVTNSKGLFMGKIIKELNSLNIKLNITAVYNSNQTKKILKSINKKPRSSFLFLLVEQETQVKIQFQSLKKSYTGKKI